MAMKLMPPAWRMPRRCLLPVLVVVLREVPAVF
jgi:hypothetical protein